MKLFIVYLVNILFKRMELMIEIVFLMLHLISILLRKKLQNLRLTATSGQQQQLKLLIQQDSF